MAGVVRRIGRVVDRRYVIRKGVLRRHVIYNVLLKVRSRRQTLKDEVIRSDLGARYAVHEISGKNAQI